MSTLVLGEFVGKIGYVPNRPVGVVFKGPISVGGREGLVAVVEWRSENMEPLVSLQSDCCRSNIQDGRCSKCHSAALWGGEPLKGDSMAFATNVADIEPFIEADVSEFQREIAEVHRWALECPMVPEWVEGVVPWSLAASGVSSADWRPRL